MAARIAFQSGIFTSSLNWRTIDSTSFLDSEAGNTALTTSYVESASFTPGAISVDGIAIKIASRASSPTGTISVRIAQAGATVAGTEVTIDVADLPLCDTTALNGGWVFFLFPGGFSVSLAAATAYTVSAKTSSASQVNLFRNATANNWARALRTTSSAAPAAGDTFIVCGEHTGAGTGNNITITMDSTANTDYGAAATSLANPAIAVSKRGTLAYQTNAATNYILRLSGHLIVYSGGTFSIGTTGSPMPRDSTAELQFDCAADGDFGLTIRNGGTFNSQGQSRSSGKNVSQCRLNTDEAVNSTSLGVDADTGWLDNDLIAVVSTTRTASQTEAGALNGNAGASSLTVDGFAGAGGGLAFAHSGTAPTQAEVILRSRNVTVRAVTAGQVTFCRFDGEATVDVDWVRFLYVGYGSGAGWQIQTTTGSCSIQHSILDTPDGLCISITGAAHNNWEIRNCTVYECVTGTEMSLSATTGTAWTIENLWFIGGDSNALPSITISDAGGTISGLVSAGCRNQGSITISDSTSTPGSISNLISHSNATGFRDLIVNGTISGVTAWRNSSFGFIPASNTTVVTTLTGVNLFGNGTANISHSNDVNRLIVMDSPVLDSEASFTTADGVRLVQGCFRLVMHSPSFGQGSAFTNADININSSSAIGYVIADNGLFSTASPVLGNANFPASLPGLNVAGMPCTVALGRYEQTDGQNRLYTRGGAILSNSSTVYGTNPLSEEMQPGSGSSATAKLCSGLCVVACNDGETVTIKAQVRKSAAYNGNAPRLMLRRQDAMGVTADTVLDTFSAAADTWEELTGTTTAALMNGAFEFYVDCDGTAGSVFVGNWEIG